MFHVKWAKLIMLATKDFHKQAHVLESVSMYVISQVVFKCVVLNQWDPSLPGIIAGVPCMVPWVG